MSTLSKEWAAFSAFPTPEARDRLASKIEAMLNGLAMPDLTDYRTGTPALNASALKGHTLAEIWQKLIEPESTPTEALIFGSLVHLALLEPEKLRAWPDHLVTAPTNPRTGEPFGVTSKAYQDAIAANAGKLVVTPDMVAQAHGCLRAFEAHPTVSRLMRAPSQKEAPLIRYHETAGVWIKGKLDMLAADFIADPKTTRETLSPHAIRSTCIGNGYDVQAAAYMFLAPRPRFHFVFVTKEEPFAARVFTMRDDYAAGDPVAENDLLFRGRELFESRVAQASAALAQTAQALRDGNALNWQQIRQLWPAYEPDCEDFADGCVPLVA